MDIPKEVATSETDPVKPAVTSSLMFQVLTFHRLRNRAIGITEDPQFERGLAWAAQRRREQEENDYLQAAFLKGFIEQAKAEIEALDTDVDTPEARNAILIQAQQLAVQIEQASQKLEELANGPVLTENQIAAT